MGVEEYINVGAAGVSLLTLVSVIWYVLRSIEPVLLDIKVDNNGHKEIIRNNTEAIKEVGRSNDNVANALEALHTAQTVQMRAVLTLLEKHDIRAEHIAKDTVAIRHDMKEVKYKIMNEGR